MALAPFIMLATALATNVVQFEDVSKKASCIMECDCARSWAIGAALIYLLAIQSAFKSGKKALPKSEDAVAPPVSPIVPKTGKAAKAA